MMTKSLFIWMVMVILRVDLIQGNPNAVPRSSCVNMLAGHSVNDVPQQPQPCPYEIVPLTKEMLMNSAVQVQVRVKSNFPTYAFRGFQLMAFDVKNPSEPIGTFSSPVNGQVMTQCPNRPMIGVSHSENSNKTVGGGTWTPPLNYAGNVVFKATFVRTLLVYWVQETSEVVTVGSSSSPSTTSTSSTTSSTTTPSTTTPDATTSSTTTPSTTTTVSTSTTMSSTLTSTEEIETSSETTPSTDTETTSELVERTSDFSFSTEEPVKTTADELTSKIVMSSRANTADDETSSSITNSDATGQEAQSSTETIMFSTDEPPMNNTKEPSPETTPMSNETGNTDKPSEEPNLTTDDNINSSNSPHQSTSIMSLEPITSSVSESVTDGSKASTEPDDVSTSLKSSTSTLESEMSSLVPSESTGSSTTNTKISPSTGSSLLPTSDDQTNTGPSSTMSRPTITATPSSSTIRTSMSTIARLSSTTTTTVEPDFTLPNKSSSIGRKTYDLIGGILVTIMLAAASSNFISL